MIHLLFAETTRTTFEWGRIRYENDWYLPLAVLFVVVSYVIYLYRRDAVELGRIAGAWLISWRLLAWLGLFLIYLQPQWRNEQDVVQPSRLLLLVDTSLSMEADDVDASPAEPSRGAQVASLLADGRWLDDLRKTHEVVVARFDRETQQLAMLERLSTTGPSAKPESGGEPVPAAFEWSTLLAPQGTETRLSSAVRQMINEHRGRPLAGLVVFSDGQQNAGAELNEAIALAREARVPVFPIGMGSTRQPVNVRVSDLNAPVRAFPSDKFTVAGLIQSQGLAGRGVTIELLSRRGSAPANTPPQVEATTTVTLGGDGETVPVKFEIPSGELGRRTLILRVTPPADDRNPQDNQREAVVEVVDRKTKVLLFAGGASREYQFLRNQLRRDEEMTVDVFLQTGADGISQDANSVLSDFPATREEMFAYDVLVAFDPDWRDLDPPQIQLVERWVGEQAGGLIAIAGSIHTPRWSQNDACRAIRDLYPVEFSRRFSLSEEEPIGSIEPWPLAFTRDGIDSPFLWLADTQTEGMAQWERFPGVFGCFRARGAKPAAKVFARFSDPAAKSVDDLLPYMAGQFYGSGRTFYLGSGEMWRLRAVDEGFFETFYTKLIRHVSQGRLLRGSNRGVLLTERDRYLPGATVELRAQLTNSKLEPLEAVQVTANVIGPDGRIESVKLLPDPNRVGNFRGQFIVRREGSYRLELPIPESNDESLSAPPIQVTIPDLERDRIERNDALLSDLARQTQEEPFAYYLGINALLGNDGDAPPLASRLRDASRTETLVAKPETLWDNAWMLAWVVGALSIEWLSRRLMKLA